MKSKKPRAMEITESKIINQKLLYPNCPVKYSSVRLSLGFGTFFGFRHIQLNDQDT